MRDAPPFIGGDVRRGVVAAPNYFESHPDINELADLAKDDLITFSNFGLESRSFAPPKDSSIPRTAHFAPRYLVNSVRAAAGTDASRSFFRAPSRRLCPFIY